MKRIILFGAPGSGKGTQAEIIEKEFPFVKISTGDLTRTEVKKKSIIGKKIEEFNSKGLLVPDNIIIEMVKNRIKQDDIKEGYILDGFPRTIEQVKGMVELEADEEVAIFLKVNEEIVVKRIMSRLFCTSCGEIFNEIYNKPNIDNVCNNCGAKLTKRTDDTEDVIKKRILVYREETLPVINYYRGKGNLHELDASRNINEIRDDIRELLK